MTQLSEEDGSFVSLMCCGPQLEHSISTVGEGPIRNC
jgi:hypothetical protein